MPRKKTKASRVGRDDSLFGDLFDFDFADGGGGEEDENNEQVPRVSAFLAGSGDAQPMMYFDGLSSMREKRDEVARMKEQNVDALDRVIEELETANDTAEAVSDGLDENTSAMLRILERQDHINENLQKGEKILGHMQGLTGGGYLSDRKFEDAKLQPVSPYNYPIFWQGWVKYNAAPNGSGQVKWEKAYMMCHGNLLSLADDEYSGEFFDEYTLTRTSYLTLFNDPDAPQYLGKLFWKKPGGFAVFSDAHEETPWLFDTPSPHAQANWVKGIQSCLEYIRLGVHDVWVDGRVQLGLRKNLRAQKRLLRAENKTRDGKYDVATNTRLDVIDELLDALHQQANTIHDQLTEQDPILVRMEGVMDQNRAQMYHQKGKMQNVMGQREVPAPGMLPELY
eukprot:g1636.t1